MMNIKKILILMFGIIISLSYSFQAFEYYNAKYFESVVVDGENSDYAWMNSNTGDLYFDDGSDSLHYFRAVHTKNELCVMLIAFDPTMQGTTDYVYFYFEGTEYYLKRSGDVCGDVSCLSKLLNSIVDFETSEFSAAGGGWKAEFCIPYSKLGIEPGINNYYDFSIKLHDRTNNMDYFWPKPLNGGLIQSDSGWVHPNWCDADDDCAEKEYCNISETDEFDNFCAEVECTSDLHCGSNTLECVNYECVLKSDVCTVNEDCAENEACQPTATYDKCLPLSCGINEEIINHTCVEKEGYCFTDNDCADNEYCAQTANPANNYCSKLTGECGYALDHQWYNYECCGDADCELDETCENHNCIKEIENLTNDSICTGDITMQLVYNTQNQKLKASIGGLENCNGKIINIQEDSCNGKVVCA
ncbi:MAG: hypothetical protein PHU63_01965, partial [Candidatus ainarchaeum sp.]|nr:hypothetical protein [Candidatus ainarchaeum sp.]